MESLFKNVAGLKVCNFIKKRLQHKGFLGVFYRTPLVAASLDIVVVKMVCVVNIKLFFLWTDFIII